ncbi:TetR/AcrR family transcriptional regulator [Streptomyces hygroscopicus]|uniref:TetR/AcrR family transcriptional regulator n=1 Tax=Streptomyces hygroscopicus TaxID=1912 RepID=UPI0008323EFA|nr:TetR/AcrR family transcriptional regulator [Streptomyces hygroscopicus]
MPPQRSKTVEALIVGAERAFAERGFHGASIGYICQCAGRTTGAFYSNYDSKLKLFLDVFRRHSDRTADYIDERIAHVDTERDLAPQLARIFADIFNAAHLDARWVFIHLEFRLMALRDREAAVALVEHEQWFSRRIGTMLDALFERCGHRPALPGTELAGLLGAMTRGVKLDRAIYAMGGVEDPLSSDQVAGALEGLFRSVA